MATSLADIHPDIMQTNILPRLDGPSLASTAAVSSSLQSVSCNQPLWSNLSKTTWPSTTDPRVNNVISTFPAGHRSFFRDSFPTLVTNLSHPHSSWSDISPQPESLPDQLISLVEIRYQNDIIYSKVEFTKITTSFLSSVFSVDLIEEYPNNNVDVNAAKLSHLKESLTLNWILVDPNLKRAANLSSIKPVRAKQDWITNSDYFTSDDNWMTCETVLQYVTVLPGYHPNEPVQCRIQVQIEGSDGEVPTFRVKRVILDLPGLNSIRLNGMDFMKIIRGALLEENNVRRKVMDDEGKLRIYSKFKLMKTEKKERAEKKWKKNEVTMKYILIVTLMLMLLFIVNPQMLI